MPYNPGDSDLFRSHSLKEMEMVKFEDFRKSIQDGTLSDPGGGCEGQVS